MLWLFSVICEAEGAFETATACHAAGGQLPRMDPGVQDTTADLTTAMDKIILPRSCEYLVVCPLWRY